MSPAFHSVDQRRFWMQNQLTLHDKPVWSLLEHFTPNEFDYGARIHPLLLIMLDCARWEATRLAGTDVRFTVTSDFRPGDDKTHGEDPCLGVDLRAHSSSSRYFIVKGLLATGFMRVGIYCDDLHVHADIGNLINPNKYPSEKMWVGECPKEGAL